MLDGVAGGFERVLPLVLNGSMVRWSFGERSEGVPGPEGGLFVVNQGGADLGGR